MKKTGLGFLAAGVVAGLVICVGAYDFVSPAITHAKFGKIMEMNPPMTKDQVEALVGMPSRMEVAESTGISGAVYHYPIINHGEVKIVLVNDVVFRAEFIPENKS